MPFGKSAVLAGDADDSDSAPDMFASSLFFAEVHHSDPILGNCLTLHDCLKTEN